MYVITSNLTIRKSGLFVNVISNSSFVSGIEIFSITEVSAQVPWFLSDPDLGDPSARCLLYLETIGSGISGLYPFKSTESGLYPLKFRL